MPADATFQLVFNGECLQGHDPRTVQRAVAAALKLDTKRSARLFSGRRVVLRRAVNQATATRYVEWFSQMGAALQAEPSGPSAEPGATQPAAAPSRAPRRRSLQRTGIGLAGLAGALALGFTLWPGLSTFWPDTPTPDGASGAAAVGSIGAVAPSPPAPAAVADDDAPQDMTPAARRERQLRYLPAPAHKAFAISSAGAHAWQAGAPSQNAAREGALAACLQALPPSRDGCRIVDADGQWEE